MPEDQEKAVEVRALKPCPFCGGEAIVGHRMEDGPIFRNWFATCTRCECEVDLCENASEAASRWNTRAALSPNMDHAVGGVLCGAGFVFDNPDTGEEYALNHPIDSGEVPDAQNVRRSTPQEDVLQEAYQAVWAEKESLRIAATPLVNQDAVREALEQIAKAHDEWSLDANFASTILARCSRIARDALATPPLDNTGLDAATVERCAKVAEEFARGDERTAEDYLESAKTAESTSGRDVDMDTAVGFSKRAGAARQIATLIRALASGDRS